jgi:acyl-CoA thioesterase-2
MPDVPEPESLPTLSERREALGLPPSKNFDRPRPVDLRHIDDPPWMQNSDTSNRRATHQVWVRATGTLPDDELTHVCAITYASDMTLLDSALLANGLVWDDDRQVMIASLDHAMWVHRPFRADDWLLYDQQSPTASNARGLAIGRFFTRDGRHVASVVQEGLMRLIAPYED